MPLPGANSSASGFKFLLRLDEEALPQREQALRVVIEKVFLLQQQIEVLFADGIDAAASQKKIPFEEQSEVPDGASLPSQWPPAEFQYS